MVSTEHRLLRKVRRQGGYSGDGHRQQWESLPMGSEPFFLGHFICSLYLLCPLSFKRRHVTSERTIVPQARHINMHINLQVVSANRHDFILGEIPVQLRDCHLKRQVKKWKDKALLNIWFNHTMLQNWPPSQNYLGWVWGFFDLFYFDDDNNSNNNNSNNNI